MQNRATKIPHSLKSFQSETRLEILDLTSLKIRRLREDLIQKFKFVNRVDIVHWNEPPLTVAPRANHRLRYKRELIKSCPQRYHFFLNRVASEWNSLPDKVVNCSTVENFKNNLVAYFKAIQR